MPLFIRYLGTLRNYSDIQGKEKKQRNKIKHLQRKKGKQDIYILWTANTNKYFIAPIWNVSCGANALLQCQYVCGGLNFFSWWIFVSSLRLSCRLKRDFDCVLLQRRLTGSNPLFALSPNTLKSVFGSDLCGLMVGGGQDLQVISPPQDFLTLTQTHRPARLRVGDSVRFLLDNRAAEVTVVSGHPRLQGRQILLACYAHLVSTLLFQIGKQKSLGGAEKKLSPSHQFPRRAWQCGDSLDAHSNVCPRIQRARRLQDPSALG